MYLYYYDWKLFPNSYCTGSCFSLCILESYFNSFHWSKNTEFCKNDAIWVRCRSSRRNKDPIFNPFFSDCPPFYYIWYWDCFFVPVGGRFWGFSFLWTLHLFWNGHFLGYPCFRFCLCLAKWSSRMGIIDIGDSKEWDITIRMYYPF